MFKKTVFLSLLASLWLLTACEKQEGFGGNASIRGNVYTRDYNTTFTLLLGEFPAVDEYVYLVFDDDISYADRICTNPAGEFEFQYLYPGKYSVYAYSNDSTFLSPTKIAITKEVDITENKQIVDVGQITILK